MADINHVVLVGRLTRNAELKYTNNGSAVSKFGLAINQRRKKDDQWVDEAHFFDIVLWGKTAESLNQYLVKGKQVGAGRPGPQQGGDLRHERHAPGKRERWTAGTGRTRGQIRRRRGSRGRGRFPGRRTGRAGQFRG